MRMVSYILAGLTLAGCQGSTGVQVEVLADSVIEVVVANQQSASASILNPDGVAMKHVQVGAGPHEAAISRDGKVAVVSIYGAQVPGNQIAVIDLVRDSVIRTIDLGQYTRPHGMAFLGASSDRIVATSEATSNVVLVNLTTGALEAIGTNARASHMIAVTADGTRGWTANVIDHNVSEIDLVNKRFVRSFTVPTQPEGIAVTPNGSEVWVGSNATGAVTVISTQTGQITRTLTGATFPYRLASSSDGRTMAIVDGQADRLRIADVATGAYTGEVTLTQPRGVSILNNKTAYVTLAAGALAVVDLATRAVLRTIQVQASPDGVAAAIARE